MFYSKKNSGLVGVSINLDEAVETPSSPVGPTTRAKSSSSNPDDLITHNPRKRKLRTHGSVEHLRSLRPRQSSSEDSSSNEVATTIG